MKKKIKKVLKKKKVASKKKTPAKKRGIKKGTKTKKVVKKVLTQFPIGKPIGKVTHFFTEISVAIVVFKQNVPAGTPLHFKGATTDFKQPANSMQYDHASVAVAKKGKQIGIKVKKRVREGDKVHKG
jgi:hypothetical protein